MEDTSAGAGLPSLGEASIVITLITLIFFALLAVSFSISSMMGGIAAFGDEVSEHVERRLLTVGDTP
jgi:uncharacterized protein involved in cysteine biosynthesis